MVVLVLAPGAARGSSAQESIFHDDATLLGLSKRDPELAMAELKALGVDTIRAFVVWRRVAPNAESREMPSGFVGSDPDSPGYDWRVYDAFVERAQRHGLKVFFTVTPPLPYWASEEPERCPHLTGGYPNLGMSCHWKPRPSLFGEFVEAVARRYAGRVDLWSLWNEPNLEHYLYPQLNLTRFGEVDVAARRYRSLWWNGWKAIAKHDPLRRGKVLFGETAAISSPMDTLYAALCLGPEGKPFKGRMRELQGCTNPRKLPIGGIAIHPYSKDAVGSVFRRAATKDSLPLPHVGRLHALIDGAARHGRIPRGRGIYLTEFGFQSNPPDVERGLSLDRQAQAHNEAERLFQADPRVRSVAQYELYDEPEPKDSDTYNTGLRLIDGTLKPLWFAYRMPLVASRLSKGVVEVWGQVRPAGDRTRATLTASLPGGPPLTVARPRTNRAGYFRVVVRRRDATRLRYRATWQSPAGEVMTSREATAGRRIRYLG